MTDVCHLNNDTKTGFGLWDLVDALDSWNVDSNEYYDDDHENDGDHGDAEDDKDDDDKWPVFWKQLFSCDAINQSVLLGRLSMDNSPLGIRFEYSCAVEQKGNSEQSKLVSVPISRTCPTQFAGVELASDHSFKMMCYQPELCVETRPLPTGVSKKTKGPSLPCQLIQLIFKRADATNCQGSLIVLVVDQLHRLLLRLQRSSE